MLRVLRVSAWNVLTLLRGPIQIALKLTIFMSLLTAISSTILVFVDTGVEHLDAAPWWISVVLAVSFWGLFFASNWLSYALDELIFKLTPPERNLFLDY